jgi:hypothetical protein
VVVFVVFVAKVCVWFVFLWGFVLGMNAAKRASAAGILRRLFVEAQSGLGSVFGV